MIDTEDVFFTAQRLEERVRIYRDSFQDVKVKPERIFYTYKYNFVTDYKIPTEQDLPILFQANIFGRSKGLETRKKLLEKGHLVSFFAGHVELISDIIDMAQMEAEKYNDGCMLFLPWLDMKENKENNPRLIWNISYQSAINKKGNFDSVSWVLFYNNWLEYYYNSIHRFL